MDRRWTNHSHPQTLQIAVFLLYFDAVLIALSGGLVSVFGLALVAGNVGAGYGIANDKRWGYVLGVVMSLLGLSVYIQALSAGAGLLDVGPIGLMFAVAQLALLLHPQSREYQRIWFS